MKILVYDVPAYCGGALTVLKEVYSYACGRTDTDWVFIINPRVKDVFENKDNIRVITANGADKSWLNRLRYDCTDLRKTAVKEKPDVILSLANVMLPVTGIKQYVYIHQSIPFSDLKYSFFKQRTLWIYKHIIAKIMYHSIKKCDRVIVQTKWMKDAVMKKCGVPEEKLIICPPKIANTSFLKYRDSNEARKCFFFPAGMSEFKNHATVVKAVKNLKNLGITDFKVLFTGNTDISEIGGESIKGLPIIMTGYMQYDDVLKQYAESVLIFPSKLETFGLPLLEARLTGSVIIAGDTPFSREILNGYENVLYFNTEDSEELAKCMQLVMNSDFKYNSAPTPFELHGGWDDVMAQLKK